ncbi:MAG: 6-pyruvoyl tetrahydropterin synthase family protein, partial [Pirellulales bacterium]|nr:6-pyruvoyl tetrahydropterin synthase family protein [Pirellulales bacterium]
MESFSVRIAKSDLTFSAAHFITLDARHCEHLHGHNYRVGVEIEGPLGDQQVVVDFLAVDRVIRELLRPLDHRVLLPTEHPTIQIVESNVQVEVVWAERRWVFPRSECVLLPLANTTAELLARYLGRQLVDALAAVPDFMPASVRLDLEETEGHSAVFV